MSLTRKPSLKDKIAALEKEKVAVEVEIKAVEKAKKRSGKN